MGDTVTGWAPGDLWFCIKDRRTTPCGMCGPCVAAGHIKITDWTA